MEKVLLQLVRLGIGHSAANTSEPIDLIKIKAVAERQGLSAVVLDGLERLRKMQPDVIGSGLQNKIMLAQWIGEVHQNFELRYKSYKQAIGELAAFYNQHGYKMMILKGYACSLDWPRPEHRPCGDIDIWQFGQYKEADGILSKEKGIEIDNSHHHHTIFNWGGFMIENHYDFINVHHHKSHLEFEKILKELGKDDTHYVEVKNEKVYLPSPNLHALFTIKHLTLHFTTVEFSLRQLLDWGFFVEKHGKDVDWEWLHKVLEDNGMKTIYGIFNAICVEDLGFNATLFSYVQYNPGLKQRVLDDVFDIVYGSEFPKRLLPRMMFRLQHWRANGWKHKLCYEESMWSSFWSGIWAHLLKPSSI